VTKCQGYLSEDSFAAIYKAAEEHGRIVEQIAPPLPGN
jgi:hypothetical protein